MEKFPNIGDMYFRSKNRLGRLVIGKLEQFDKDNDALVGEEDDVHTTLLDDTQEIDISGLLDDENIVRGEE